MAKDHGAEAEMKTSSGKTFRESHGLSPELGEYGGGSTGGDEGEVDSSIESAWFSAQTRVVVRKNKKHKVLLPGDDTAQHEIGGPDQADVWAAMEQVSPTPKPVLVCVCVCV